MSDRYLTFSQSNLGRKIFKTLGLPIPPVLRRAEGNPYTLGTKVILLGGLNEQPEQVNTRNTTAYSLREILKDENTRDEAAVGSFYSAFVFNAVEIKCAEDLYALYKFFHQHLGQLSPGGKIVVVGINPKQCTNHQQATAQRGLVGFIKALAKEVGRKGITANLIFESENSNHSLAAPLRFLLSNRSAFVDGQVITLNQLVSVPLEVAKQSWQKPLAGKVALVTGASRGIGATVAKTLSRDGAKVIGLDIPQATSTLRATMAAIGGEAFIADITDTAAPEAIANMIRSLTGTIDIVVHNAGITRDKMLTKMSRQQWDQVIDINLLGVERINAHLLDNQLINEAGRIICVSSISGIAGNLGQTNYATSKASIIGLIESMAPELAEKNITINAVAPGFIETDMTASLPLMTRFLGRRICALSQGGKPIDVAETIAFLAAPQAQGVSANLIRVCGLNLIGT